MKKIRKLLNEYVKKPYYYVPPCPRCGSHITGKFVRMRGTHDTDWMITEALRNGELIAPVPEILEDTAYCVECDHTWNAQISMQMLTQEEIQQQKVLRMTNQILAARYSQIKEEEKKKNRGFIIGSFAKFIGKI